MIRPGLVSVTFRSLSPKHIIDLSVQAGIEGIECPFVVFGVILAHSEVIIDIGILILLRILVDGRRRVGGEPANPPSAGKRVPDRSRR